ncbi:MAG: glycosyltransferase family 4 protein [Coriobacteriia bacterium]|nr:glycosyltransferase family 4 protein [Coriobacteriia bacterium]
MTTRLSSDEHLCDRGRAALFVTTVPITLEAFLVPFAKHLRAQGWRIDALANGATRAETIATEYDQHFDIGWSRNPLALGNVSGTAAAIRRVVEAGDYDIVHVHTPIAAFVTRYALRGRPRAERPAVIYTAHGFHFYRGGAPTSNAVYERLERAAAAWTDYLVTINAEDFSAARDFGTIDPERVRLIPGIGVDVDAYGPTAASDAEIAALREKLDLPADAFVLTMIAEFGAVKRHEHAFKALSLVDDPRVVLVLAGDGPLESRLREQAMALGIETRIRWIGYRRDVPTLLAASDALMLCSEREGLNRSVLEAMAAGKPVIGTDTRGIADAITPDTGWLADKNDPASLAAAISAAVRDPHEAARRGHAGRERAVAEYALPRIIDAYEELYREALASRV